jgi:hypothetical protein
MLSSNMLLLNLILLIDVTFSTPTGVYTRLRRFFASRETCIAYSAVWINDQTLSSMICHFFTWIGSRLRARHYTFDL